MKIITISREYGAGGHAVGEEVAKKLGIKFYDKEAIRAEAVKLGLDPEIAEHAEESLSKGQMFKNLLSAADLNPQDELYLAEKAVIEKIAAEGPCVILGRCAGDILKKEGYDVCDVFLFGDLADRAERVQKLMETDSASKLIKEMKKQDEARKNYFECYTGRKMTEVGARTMCLSTSELDASMCAELICKAAEA